jgi:hypothetical protein
MAENDLGNAALAAQVADLNKRLDAFEKRLATIASPANVPAARLSQIEEGVSLLGAMLHEIKVEGFKTDVSGLQLQINEKLRPLRARMNGAEAPELQQAAE